MKSSVLVVRKYDRFSEILTQNGLEAVNFPVIETRPVENLSGLDRELEKIDSYDGLFVTSPRAAEVFCRRCVERRIGFGGKIYVLGRRAAAVFEKTNFETVFRENANTAKELIDSFDRREFAGKRFLFLRGDKSLRTIPQLLGEMAEISETIVYRTTERRGDEKLSGEIGARLDRNGFGWICFFSPSGLESLIERFGEKRLQTARLAVIGPTTAKAAAERNLEIDFISPKATAADFAFGLIERIKEIE